MRAFWKMVTAAWKLIWKMVTALWNAIWKFWNAGFWNTRFAAGFCAACALAGGAVLTFKTDNRDLDLQQMEFATALIKEFDEDRELKREVVGLALQLVNEVSNDALKREYASANALLEAGPGGYISRRLYVEGPNDGWMFPFGDRPNKNDPPTPILQWSTARWGVHELFLQVQRAIGDEWSALTEDENALLELYTSPDEEPVDIIRCDGLGTWIPVAANSGTRQIYLKNKTGKNIRHALIRVIGPPMAKGGSTYMVVAEPQGPAHIQQVLSGVWPTRNAEVIYQSSDDIQVEIWIMRIDDPPSARKLEPLRIRIGEHDDDRTLASEEEARVTVPLKGGEGLHLYNPNNVRLEFLLGVKEVGLSSVVKR